MVLPRERKEGQRGELGDEPELSAAMAAVAVLGLCVRKKSSALPFIGKGGGDRWREHKR